MVLTLVVGGKLFPPILSLRPPSAWSLLLRLHAGCGIGLWTVAHGTSLQVGRGQNPPAGKVAKETLVYPVFIVGAS